jgi:hypothetical protein
MCECGERKEELMSWAEKKGGVKCSCGKPMDDDFNAPNRVPQTDHERLSNALAVDISQLESGEAQRLHPGTEWVVVGDMACPKIRNRAEKKRMLRERGWVEYT